MKFLHTADLHIGKKLFEQSLLEDQKYILDCIQTIAMEEKVDAVVIAGDIYDRSVPPAEAVTLLDDFLTGLLKNGIQVLAISGNHDSPERVGFAGRILEKQGLYIVGESGDEIKTVVLEDAYGPVFFYLLPFFKPATVSAGSSAEAVETLLGRTPMTLNRNRRSVMVTHFFVVGAGGEEPELSDSETDSYVGGLDGVPAGLFNGFDYVALGHIHKPQHMGGGKVFYSGSPLKYSFSEANSGKSVSIVELAAPGSGASVRRIPLKPLRDLRCIKGKLEELMLHGMFNEDYLQVTLTDREELIDPMGTLRSVYPNVLQILMEKNLSDQGEAYQSKLRGKRKTTEELFEEFYEQLRGEPMDEKRRELVAEAAKNAEDSL